MKGIEFLGASLKRVREIRIQFEGQYRVIYVASFEEKVTCYMPLKRKLRKQASRI